MKPMYNDFDELVFDDAAIVSRMLREQRRADRRLASRRSSGPRDWDRLDDQDWEDYDDFEDSELGFRY